MKMGSPIQTEMGGRRSRRHLTTEEPTMMTEVWVGCPENSGPVVQVKHGQRSKTTHTEIHTHTHTQRHKKCFCVFQSTTKTSTLVTHTQSEGGSDHTLWQALGFHLRHSGPGDDRFELTQFSDTTHVADAKHSFKYVYYFPHNNPVR